MPIEIEYGEDGVEVKVICDACSRDYMITCEDEGGLHLCPFCGNYLEVGGVWVVPFSLLASPPHSLIR